MKPNSDRVDRVLSYFDGKDLQQLRLDFCVEFKLTEQTYFNKVSKTRLPGSFMSHRQADWLEKWAKEHGMPDDYQPEAFIGQIPAPTE